MKKYFVFMVLIALLFSQLTFAQTSTPTTTLPKYKHTTKTYYKTKKQTPYNACVGQKVKELTKEMQSKKKEALNEFKTAFKNATSTEAKTQARKNYTQKLREINKWFNQEVRNAKKECKNLKTSTSTPSSSQQ